MMKIEIRNDCVLIDGYVNAVERDSKILKDSEGSFIEKIKAGAFRRALERAKRSKYNVKVLLNHDYDRQLTSTGDSTTELYEDAIGLRCRCLITDEEVIQKAINRNLVGWSFGFLPLKEEKTDVNRMTHRIVRDLELKEVSILDDTKIPAYDGTSIEVRSEQAEDLIEVRLLNDEIETEDKTTKPKSYDNSEYEKRYMSTRAGL